VFVFAAGLFSQGDNIFHEQKCFGLVMRLAIFHACQWESDHGNHSLQQAITKPVSSLVLKGCRVGPIFMRASGRRLAKCASYYVAARLLLKNHCDLPDKRRCIGQ
jgi:hypothetical protein